MSGVRLLGPCDEKDAIIGAGLIPSTVVAGVI
jgi:hypothetical protein